MAYREVCESISYPEGTTDRYKRLDGLDRMLDGTLFDKLPHAFNVEEIDGNYIEIAKRRPDTPFNVARIVVDQTSGLLFGGEQMPLIKCGKANDKGDASDAQTANVEQIVVNCELDALMMEVYEYGSSGSVFVVVRSDRYNAPYFDVIRGKHGKPLWDPLAPSHMLGFQNIYPTKASELRASGVVLDEDVSDADDYWMRIVLDDTEETRFRPLPAHEYANLGSKRNDGSIIAWVPDQVYTHGFGVVPVIAGKNLIYGDGDDGRATFDAIKDIQVQISQMLSQVGRGYRYSADPMLARRRGELDAAVRAIDPLADEDTFEMRGPGGETVRSSSNILDLGRDGDAKLLEITGNGLRAAIDYIKTLREWALELVGAMKSDAEHTKGVASGRALEMLYQSMQLLLKRQRIAYGTRFLIPLVRLLMTGIERGCIAIDDVTNCDPTIRMTLKWPQWMTPRGAELSQSASAWQTLAGGSPQAPVIVLPPRTVTEIAANELGLQDPSTIADEVDQLRGEQQQQLEEAASGNDDATSATE